MLNIIFTNLGQSLLESSKLQSAKKLETSEPETAPDDFEDDCAQCEIEKMKKPCSICED